MGLNKRTTDLSGHGGAGAGSGFSPRDAVRLLARQPLKRGSKNYFEAPETYLLGKWEDKHPLNVPGPFYGAATDTCCDGPWLAPASLLYDSEGMGFVWRQPRDEAETLALMTGASSDPFSAYACDGDDHWTADQVRTWWREREAHQPAVDMIVSELGSPGYPADEYALISPIVSRYLGYRQSTMERDLRRYVFFLEVGTYPEAADELPQL
jgi:hypothetical protein